MFGWIWIAFARAECDDREARLAELERAALAGEVDAAVTASKQVIAAFGCGPLASPEHLSRLWLAEAAIASALGELSGADRALEAAASIAPERWDARYGAALEARWWTAHTPASTQELSVSEPEGTKAYTVAVDGAVVVWPARLRSGFHVVQVGTSPAEVLIALKFDLTPGQELLLEPLLPPVVEDNAVPDTVAGIQPPPPPDPRRKRRLVQALAVGGAAVLTYGLAGITHAAYQSSPSDGLLLATDGLVIGSAGVGLTSGVLLGRALLAE